MKDIYYYINSFINYSIDNNLISEYDAIYVINKIITTLKINNYPYEFKREKNDLIIDDILDGIIVYAIKNNIIEDYNYQKDLFDTMIMDTVTPYPTTVITRFFNEYKINPKKATDYFYNLMISCNYIRMNRIKKNIVFNGKSKYGDIVISINLAKPEKDPKEIAKLKEHKSQMNYPKCVLCYENVGFSGNANLQARNNLRVIPITLNNEQFYFQYSPYVYYNEHCIVFKKEHQDMHISSETFKRLLDFVDLFPDYFLGSNADLPIVGGSILAHEHYQGGLFDFPIDNASIRYSTLIDNCVVNYLNWPLDCLQLVSDSKEDISSLADRILVKWQNYSNPSISIINKTNEIIHNTVTPMARKKDNKYILNIVLRNNLTTKDKPYGLFHPDVDLQHIKRENIGIIEVMGLAILPGRLKYELGILKDILDGLRSEDDLAIIENHKDWYYYLKNKKDLDINQELTDIFVKVLESCQVFKYGNINDVINFINEL